MSKPANFQANKNVSEIARRTGVSITTVSRKLASGKTEDDIIREAEQYNAKQGRHEDDSSGDLETKWQAERRKEIALADLRELELAERRDELVPIADVNTWVAGMILRSRDVLLRIAPELRDRLAQETNPIKVQEMLDGEIYRALNALSEFVHTEE